jgi:hypothetical protein
MEIISSGTVYSGADDPRRQSCAFPGVCVLPDGRWLCSFRAAPTKTGTRGQHTPLTWSDDLGATWHEPLEPFAPPPVDGKPGLFRAGYLTPLGGDEVLATLYWVDHSDPDKPFFNQATEGLLDSRLMLSRSCDRGETWTAPEPIDTSPFHMPTPITGPTLLLPDGQWACQFELNKAYDDASQWRHHSVLLFSADGGRTWPRHTHSSGDPANRVFYWDQRPNVLSDGRILDLFWTYDTHEALYLNIHARESVDKGRTWSGMWDTGVPGQPAQPVPLRHGAIAMVYVDRTGAPEIKLRVSQDGGRTWPRETEGVIARPKLDVQSTTKDTMQDTWAEMEQFSLGLPAATALEDGTLLVVYYQGPHMDRTQVMWARVAV